MTKVFWKVNIIWRGMRLIMHLKKAGKSIVKDVMKDGILDKARESGKKQLTELFKAFGFKEVYVDIE